MDSQPLLNWPAIWRTLLIMVPVALVCQFLGAVAREKLGVPIPPEAISGAVGVSAIFVLIAITRRMEAKEAQEDPSPAD